MQQQNTQSLSTNHRHLTDIDKIYKHDYDQEKQNRKRKQT